MFDLLKNIDSRMRYLDSALLGKPLPQQPISTPEEMVERVCIRIPELREIAAAGDLAALGKLMRIEELLNIARQRRTKESRP